MVLNGSTRGGGAANWPEVFFFFPNFLFFKRFYFSVREKDSMGEGRGAEQARKADSRIMT